MDHAPRWQFSLLTMFALTSVVAAACAAATSPPHWASGLALGFLSFAFPVGLILVIVYGEGYWRAFSIGALVPCLEGWVMSGLAVLWVAGVETVTSIAPVAGPPTVAAAPPAYTPGSAVPAAQTGGGYSADLGPSSDEAPAAASPPVEARDSAVTPASPAVAVGSGLNLPDEASDPAVTPAAFEALAASTTAAPVAATASVPVSAPVSASSMSYGIEYDSFLPMAASFARVYRVGGAVYWSFAAVLGFFAVAVRWLIERNRPELRSRN